MKKKGVFLLLSLFSIVGCAATLTACNLSEGGDSTGTPPHAHEYVDEIVAPTCTAEGYTRHTCACGDSYQDNQTAKIPHTEEVYGNGYAASCTNSGLTDGKRCTVCKTVTVEQTTIPATGHASDSWNYYTDFQHRGVCSACGETVTYNHDFVSSVCKDCDFTANYTLGLAYKEITENGAAAYEVTGIGKATDTDIVIPSTYNGKPVTRISQNAFFNCGSITSFYIPASVINIGRYPFRNCGSLESIVVAKDNAHYNDNGKCLIETATKTILSGCNNSVIPSDGSVTSIDIFAFCGCISLKSITIPASVTDIDNSAFRGCIALESITVASGNTKYRSSNNCIIEKNTVIVGCKNSVIPNDVRIIGEYAFADCSTLTSINIHNQITKISRGAFNGCTSLTSISLPESLNSKDGLGAYSFTNCTGLTSVTIPASVQVIGFGSFENCTSLQSVTILHERTSTSWSVLIEPSAFAYCTSLINIKFPNDVTIGECAFSGCTALENVDFPQGDVSIITNAFQNCTSLKRIYIPAGVHTIATRAFAFCSAVESIEVASDNKYFHSSGNCLIYSAPYNTILAGCKNSVIPTDGSITYIDECAFARCSIENIVIPEGVQTIGKGAFAGCDELRSVVLPESLKEIYEEAFASCAFLSAATFNGTTEQWLNIEKGNGWKELTSDFIITCTDGRVTASGYVLGKDDQF